MGSFGNFFKNIFGFIQTAIFLVLFLGYTYSVSKFSAQLGVNSQGNPIKQKVLKTTLGVEPPEGANIFGLDLKKLTDDKCEEEQGAAVKPEEGFSNIFLLALFEVFEPSTLENKQTGEDK